MWTCYKETTLYAYVLSGTGRWQTTQLLLLKLLQQREILLGTYYSLSLSLGKIITPIINKASIKAHAVILRALEALKKNSEARVPANNN